MGNMWSSKRMLIIASPLVLVLAVITGIVAFNNENAYKNTSYLLKRGYKLLDKSDETYSQVQAMESSGNTYLFTRDPVALSDFRTGASRALGLIDSLTYLTHNEPVLHASIDSLTGLINSHIVFINSCLDLVNTKEFSKDEQLDYLYRNRYYRNRINSVLAEIMIEENGLLKRQEEASSKNANSFHWVFSTLLACTFLLLASVIFLLIRGVQQREQADKKLKEKQEILLKISDFSPVPTFIAEKGTEKLVYANEACKALFKKGSKEIIGKPVSQIAGCFAIPHAEMLRNLERAKEEGLTNGINVKIKISENETKDMLYSADRLEIDNRICYLESVVDISELKQAEKAIKVALEHEKELNEIKSKFVSFASHEFRTPLTTIFSSASLVERYHEMKQDEMSTKHINRIKSNVKDLIELLNDFLSLGKIGEGKIVSSPEMLNLADFTDEIMENMKGLVKSGQKIIFGTSGVPEQIFVDEKLLRNVLNNLLSNAIKYSPPDSNINFDIIGDGQKIVFAIKDHGIGIPEKDQPRLFESFFRSSNVSQIPGTGLGLNIVKSYLSLMGGLISFTSKENQGTTFTVTLPLNA